jgi:Trk K+ transport system NAD-binding subunit
MRHSGLYNPSAPGARFRRHHRIQTAWVYLRLLIRQSRWKLFVLTAAVALGTLLYSIEPHPATGVRRSFGICLYGGWMALLAQPLDSPPRVWYLDLLCAVDPVLGIVLIGDGIVRLAMLMISRQLGERQWMQAMASVYRNHIVLCGLGHLGFRVLEQMRRADMEVVCVEVNPANRFISHAKTMGAAVLIRDMTEDASLLDAGIADADAIIIASDSDMANLEVALDARRLNPKIRIILRLFDQQLASKISGALTVDAAFSASALAAPAVAAMVMRSRILGSSSIAGALHVMAEVKLQTGSAFVGQSVSSFESTNAARILAVTTAAGDVHSPPTAGELLSKGDTLVIHCAEHRLMGLLDGAVHA